MKKLFPVLLACAGIVAPIFAQSPAAAPASVPTSSAGPAPLHRLGKGDVAPEFTVTGPKGDAIKLGDFRGKVVVVDVSATWCGPCQAAMPNNDRVFRKYAYQGVVLLGVTADDTKAAYDGWVSRNASKYQFTMTFDPVGRDGWATSVFNTQYNVTGFPTMFVISRDGKISELVSGGGPGDDYRLEYALARAGVKVDLASLPPEPKKDPNAPKSIPAMTKTMAKPMIGMGGGTNAAPGKFGSIEAGAMVPDFTATGPDGQPVKLSQFKGKTVVITFFSNTEHGPEAYAPKFVAKYADQGVVFLAVASAMEKPAFDAWVVSAKPAYATAWDPAGKAWGENITNLSFGVGMYPAFVVVDRAGKLAGGYIGMGDKNVERLATHLLAAGVKLDTDDMPKMSAALIVPHKAEGPMTAAQKIPTLGAGAHAPDFTTYTVDGKAVKLSDFAGKIVILDFWATWCGPCMASMPHTQEIAEKYRDQDVVVLASCTSDTKAKFGEWIPKNQKKYSAILFTSDPNERGSATFDDRASFKLYHVQGIPTQFVIDRDGKIAATIVGYNGNDEARAEATLAKLGVKVDAAVAAAGEKQLQESAEEAVKEAAAAAAAEKNPPPPFRESFGKIRGGDVVPDFTVQTADGKTAKFSDYAKGKTVIFDFWATWCGPCQMAMPHLEEYSKKYRDQNVVVLGLCCFDTREAYDKWLKANGAKYTFPTVFDPAGKPKLASTEEMNEMTPEDKAAAQATAKKYYADVIASGIFGAFPMLPTTLVINSEGKLVGTYAGYREGKNEALGNLLLRAGVKVAPDDMPTRVYTAAETKEAPPEPKVATLKIGAIAPEFTARDAAGKDVKLSDYKGKVVILDFWATWCGPCMSAMPHTQEVAAHYKDQGVVVLGSCTSDTRAKFEAWVKNNAEKYPDIVWSHDPAERSPERASHKLYGVGGIPCQFIIDREGRVADIVIGYLKGEAILDAALAKAGIKVDPALVEKGAADLKKRS